MHLNARIVLLADHWASASDRSVATLATRVANDGKLIDRLREGKGCNVATAERFFAFFRDPANWPGNGVPPEVAEHLDGVDLGMSSHNAADTTAVAGTSPGNIGEISAAAVPA